MFYPRSRTSNISRSFSNFIVETLSEDEDDVIGVGLEGISVAAGHYLADSNSEFTPTPGGPFSALTPSMWPEDLLAKLGNPVRCYIKMIMRMIFQVVCDPET